MLLSSERHSWPGMRACAVGVFSALGLVACGGGSSSDSSGNGLIIGAPSGEPAAMVATRDLQLSAATRAAAGLGGNLDRLQRLSNDAQPGLLAGNLSDSLVNVTEADVFQGLETDNSNFLFNTLGIDDPLAGVQREGNIITIDPDEQGVCAEEFPLIDSLNDDVIRCEQLVSELSVEINAQTDQAGVISYSFQSAPVLLIGYSAMGTSYELRLAALQQLIERDQQLSGDPQTSSSTSLAGALRLSATITNSEIGAEAGEIALEVTEAIRIYPTGNVSAEYFSLQPSTVFRIQADEATGAVSTSVDWGTMQLVTESGDSAGNFATTRLLLGGLSANAKLQTESAVVQLSNLGIGGVPLTVTINEVESLRLNLANFGLTLDGNTGMLRLDGTLAAALTLNNMMGLVEELGNEVTATLGLDAPTGTGFIEQASGAIEVVGTGPLSLSAMAFGNGQSLQQSFVATQGECFSSGTQELETADSDFSLDVYLVPCDP